LAGNDDEDEAGQDADTNPAKYKLKEKDLKLRVEYDVAKGRLEVRRKKMDLHTLDETNGVDIELHIGTSVAVENITMRDHEGKKLIFDIREK